MMFWVISNPICNDVDNFDKDNDQSFVFASAEKKVFFKWLMIDGPRMRLINHLVQTFVVLY